MRQTISGLLIATALAPAIAWTQVDTSDWKCELCPFESGYRADTGAGVNYVSDDAYRFGNASGYDESGAYLLLNGEGYYSSDGYQLNWYAEDLGLDSRNFEIDGGRQGSFGFYLGYRELPYRLFDTTSSVFTRNSADTLTLPPGWVTASQTSGFTALDTALQPIQIGSDRQTISLGGDYTAANRISFYADYRRDNRDGIDIVSGASFFQSSLLPRYFDFETDSIDAGIRYAGGPWTLSAGWYGSFFRNNQASLTWDNPFTAVPGAEQGQLAQEPDNDFQQVSVSGAYTAKAMHSVIAFSAALGQGTQTATLLPYTVNPLLNTGPLPRTAHDGKVDTANYALTITSRPLPKARINVAYRFDERDNRSSAEPWSRIIVDSFPSGDVEINTPYSFDRSRFTIGGSYRLLDAIRVSGGYNRTELNRDFQEVAEQTEDKSWLGARLRLAGWLELTAKGGTAKREIDRYDTNVASTFGQNPLMRKYNLAYRFREYGEVALSITPSGIPLSVGVSTRYSDDSYSKSELGLNDSDSLYYTADVNYSLSENASFYLLAGTEDIDARQSGSASFSTPTWQAVHRDRFDHYGFGLQLSKLGERASLSLDYLATDGDTHIDVVASGGGPLPVISSELESLRLNLDIEARAQLWLNLSLRYESFRTSDWAIEGVEPDTISTVLALGADPWNYDVWVAGISFRYLIGAREISFPE
jgi:MtrB/PioB family decaheme-associated outer membrane protein